ncbi:2-iminoacetate synthase ThiH [Riemerella anatipestifer]|uniref:2-iminoacetate synthase ThiH n=1 Tax=Riemerella anatipestifer TaxID=34085 RepID=UPI001AD74F4E|nr:2-iminoacetate synthase ThiH [Riemerella anatipestifer]MBO4232745.1 2-iminoacetate synthase ThiH [Riemerella anatipestifer]MCO7352163.1 2-iminoacetate synthase ThiH [Riemerella anatipestifer]MCQ4040084.1 2-iminoacetate synthase ThiH [Riemerella anatipestifer]MCT6764254.1 2-iminoacetate synthase ThiH [Riemerella anatipestifer]MCT6766390.1 2-iminoacetate synthase ThiH [Riemerella anatipestifer]
MDSFNQVLAQYTWDEVLESIYQKTEREVQQALAHPKRNLEDFKALISPAGQPYLEQMAKESHLKTRKRFGNTMQMYAPMYLSNECHNICTYCGFSFSNQIPRRTLTDDEILKEAQFIKNKGYKHILLVTGEANRTVGVDYLENAIRLLRPYFANISIEVQPLNQEEYERLKKAGLYATLVYQETYHRETYRQHHPKGKKSNFDFRLETPDRLGRAGLHKIGIGALLGLEDWRADSFFTALHLKYLQKRYWKTKYSISFPRLRPFSGGLEPKVAMTDADLVQLICAYRLLDEDIELSISTRESAKFRDHIVHLGITSMSAESKTNPGGYVVEPQSLEQFEISDERTTEEIHKMLIENNIEPVWKDWEKTW